MGNSLSHIDSIIFDVGGVICTPSRTSQFVEWAVSEHGIEAESFRASLSQLRSAFSGKSITEDVFFESIQGLGIPLSVNEIKDVYITHNFPNADMQALLHKLKERGLKLAILSNSIPPITKKVREDLRGIFDVEVFSDEIGIRKPDPDMWTETLKLLGKRPDQCLFIDDKAKNLSVPAEMGMAVEQFISPEELIKVLREKYKLNLE